MAVCRILFLAITLIGDHAMGARIQQKRLVAGAGADDAAGVDAGKAAPRQYKRIHAKTEQHKGAAQADASMDENQASTVEVTVSSSFVQSKASQTFAAVIAKIPKDNSSERLLLGLAVLAFLILVMVGAFCFGSCCLKDGKNKKELRNDLLTSSPGSTTSSGTSSSKTPSWVTSFDESQYPRESHTHQGRVVYEWSQNEDMACVFIKVPEGTNRHDLDIRISSRHLQVGKKGKPAFMTEETYDTVNQEQSGWRLRSCGELQIHLAKNEPGTWPCVLLVRDKEQDA